MPPEPSEPQRRPSAVLCDAIGTILRLDRPVERLRGSLAARGILLDEAAAVRALSAEVRAYREGHLSGVDTASITALRHACADAMRKEIGHGLDHDRAFAIVMGLTRFEVLPGTRSSLARLRRAGVRLAVVSDWDASLEGTMLAVGLRSHFDVVVSSAQIGVAKPDPAPLLAATAALGVRPQEAVMIGHAEVDDAAAAACGMPSLRVATASGIRGVTDHLLGLPR
ncbi:MAG: HAD-IA family hydrolase [Patulibacter minatonensis]